MQSVLYTVVGLAMGLVLAIAFYRWSRRAVVSMAEFEQLRAERDRLLGELLRERATADEQAQRAAKAEGLLQASSELSDRALSAALQEVRDGRAALQTQGEELRALHEQCAAQQANLVHSERAKQELQAFVSEAQSRLSAAFAELAGAAFDRKAEVFEKNVKAAGVQSKSDIDLLLKPFAERLAQFSQRLEALYGTEAKDRASLLGAVTELKSLNQDMADKTAALTRALKGNAKVRGDWGELMLESVLRSCGLEEGAHYERQRSSTAEDGQRLRPDIVVRLPDDRRVVVDSKVNLLAWIDAMNAETPESQNEALRRHAIALRQHVKDLGEKNYPKSLGESALEITVAFVPIEGALSAALGFDPALQAYAFERRVVFASPNTLMALLGVVERLWTRDKIQRRTSEISELGGKLVDALIKFLEDFDRLGARLNMASDAFAEARRSLSESNQALLPRARRLVELGARGKKLLPEELQPDLLEQVESTLDARIQDSLAAPEPAQSDYQ